MTEQPDQVDAVRRRLVESEHRAWIDTLEQRTGWPRRCIIDCLIAANCDRQRLFDDYERFRSMDNLNPFTEPPPAERFLSFVQS